ncbi:hypothetical protein KGF57_004745 [Candida theae]|uniref:Assembly chaperone of RPL4 n=1 Tax=Candida theae TaxID=1198502 RepID=A0AAD5BAC1_9ASCO|nr:uncharacterized protein KGF57_004745 [Candida theae]KAI5949147.1 hypothetical protein KGF57_004745 [Candida theae]
MSEIIPQARGFLVTSQPEKALEILTPHIASNAKSPEFLAILGEALLENNDLQQAYEVLIQACELDSDAALGVEKFLYLGQIIGGADGLNYVNTGLNRLNEILTSISQDGGVTREELVKGGYKDINEYKTWAIKKLNSGIFASIEIWMTDLCMEPEAESKCNELIEFSLSIDPTNPESLSILSSIRISQQRQQEAVEALQRSWELFKLQKTKLEDFANKKEEEESSSGGDAFEVGMEYVELIQPLITLSRYAIELEQYDTAIEIASNVQDINDSILDAFYIEALANLFKAKQTSFANTGQANDEEFDYREVEVSQLKDTSEIKQLLADTRSILTSAYKISNSEYGAENDPVLVEQVNELLNSLGGPIMSELMPKRDNLDDAEVANWETEIVSDDE